MCASCQQYGGARSVAEVIDDPVRRSGLASLPAGIQWMSASKIGKAGIISIGGDPFHATLDGEGSQIRIRVEVALGVGFIA